MAWEESLVVSAWMKGEWGCRFSLQSYLLQVADILQLPQCEKKKKKQAGVLEHCLTRFFEGNIWRSFIYLYSDLTTEMHQLVFRGFQLKKASFLVSRRFKESAHTIEEKKNMSGKETARLTRHTNEESKNYTEIKGGENRGNIAGLHLHKQDPL